MLQKLAAMLLAVSLGLLAEAPKRNVQVITTDRSPFTAGETIRIMHSWGQLNIESWDQAEVEITVTRSTFATDTPASRDAAKRALDAIKVTANRSKDELVIATVYPSRNLFKRPFRGKSDTDLNYRIRAPRDARLVIRQGTGDIVVYDMAGDVQASTHIGDILIQLPESGQYAIDAKAKVGGVYADYGGVHRHPWIRGEQFSSTAASAPHKLTLRVGLGDIKIQKMAPDPIVTTKP